MKLLNVRFSVGDRVVSAAVGKRAAFEGVVALKRDNEIVTVDGQRLVKVDGYYHVRDDAGMLWHRDDIELSPVAAACAA